MQRSIFIIAIAGFLWIGCNDAGESDATRRKNAFTPPATKEDSLYHDVMEGHDIGMAKMNTLRKYLGQVQKALDSINKLPSAKQDEQYQQALLDLQEDLNYADYSMFTWMQEFKNDSARNNKELRIRYLQGEREKVTKVKENILGSLHRADSLLNR